MVLGATTAFAALWGSGFLPAALGPVTIQAQAANNPPLAVSDGTMRQTATLAPAARDSRLSHIVIDGDTALVGVDHDDAAAIDGGAVYAYRRVGTDWVLRQRLTASDAADFAHFGYSVALDGDRAIVGAVDGGAAYVFERTGETWSQVQEITAASVAMTSDDQFGISVALDGDRALVGADHYDVSGVSNTGAVVTFARAGGTWAYAQTLSAIGAAAEDRFGWAVALDGDQALVGAFYDDLPGKANAGSVYAFDFSGGAWTQTQQINAADALAGDWFGHGLALHGDTALIGADWGDNGAATNRGAAYFFTRSGGTWTQTQKVNASDAALGDHFGSAVDFEGDSAVIGAYSDDTSAGTDAGSAYFFVRSPGGWVEASRLSPTEAEANGYFGSSVAISGDTIMGGIESNMDPAFVFTRCFVTDEDVVLSASAAQSVLANDRDIDGDVLTASAVNTSTLRGTIDLKPDGTFDYTPEPNFNGTTIWSYHAWDGVEYSNVVTITVVVNPLNDAPVAPNETVTIDEDTKATLNVLTHATDVDTPKASLVATAFSTPTTGTIETMPSGEVTYTPPANWSGTARFAYKVYDGYLSSSAGTVTVVVNPVNDLPVAMSDGDMKELQRTTNPVNSQFYGSAVAVDGDTAVVGSYRENQGAAYVYVRDRGRWIQQARLGNPAPQWLYGTAVAIDGDTIVVGNYNANTYGSGSGAAYVYVRAGASWSLQQTLYAPDAAAGDNFGNAVTISGDTIAVSVPYDDWSATLHTAGSVRVFTRAGTTWSQQAALTVTREPYELLGFKSGLGGSCLDLDGNTLVAGAWLDVAYGQRGSAFVWRRDGASWGQPYELVPTTGPASNEQFGRNVQVVGDAALVSSPGRSCVFTRDGVVWRMDQEISHTGGGVVSTDFDGATMVFGRPELDAPVVDVYRKRAGVWTRVNSLAGSGASGGIAGTNFGHAVAAQGDKLIAGSRFFNTPVQFRGGAVYFFDLTEYATDEDYPLSVIAERGVLVNDYDIENNALTPSLVDTSAAHGTFDLKADGSFTYTPEKDFAGTAVATYRDFDGAGNSNTATITVTVNPVNDAPVAPNESLTIDEDTKATLNVLAHATDAETPKSSLVATAFSAPTTGTIETLPSGEVTYTPPADWNGTATFTYKVFDGSLTSGTGTVTIRVNPVNDPPIGVADDRVCLQSAAESFNVLANDIDIDTDRASLRATAFTQPTIGALTSSASGEVTYTPPTLFLGTATFTYRVTDGEYTSDPVTVTVAVRRRTITRVGGADRYEAAANFARRGWDANGTKSWTGVSHVIIANGEDTKEADPLCAAGLAGVYDAPILLVKSRSIPGYTRVALTEIAAANPGVRITMVGGTASIPIARWRDMQKIPGVDPTYDRIGGADRYAVSAGIASRMVLAKGTRAVPGVILVAADNPKAFYDGLAVGPIAYANAMPLLAVRKGYIPSVSRTVLEGELAGKPRYAASSSAYISAAVAGRATRLTNSSDRYTAAAQIGNVALSRDWLIEDEAGVAAKLPDALTGGAFLGKHDGVLLFTDSDDTMQPATSGFLKQHYGEIIWGWILGGTGSVTPAQEATFRALLK